MSNSREWRPRFMAKDGELPFIIISDGIDGYWFNPELTLTDVELKTSSWAIDQCPYELMPINNLAVLLYCGQK